MTSQLEKQIVLSGIRATGKLHLGNLLGAILNFVELSQDPTKKCYFFIANLHTLTTYKKADAKEIDANLRRIVIDFLAAGIDPNSSLIYAQSSIPELCELMWLLNCMTHVGLLAKMAHFREKTGHAASAPGALADAAALKAELENINAANSGLLTYPVLMAADILSVRANLVPVGEDQIPHVELTRRLARKFNSHHGDFFPIPEHKVAIATRVPSLAKNVSGKMGKSSADGTINLDDSPDKVQQLFRRAPTDPNRVHPHDKGDPGKCNIYTMHTLISSKEETAWAYDGCTNGLFGCAECKKVAAKNVSAILTPIQGKQAELLQKPASFITDLLHDHGKMARATVKETVDQAKELMGVRAY